LVVVVEVVVVVVVATVLIAFEDKAGVNLNLFFMQSITVLRNFTSL
jgi:hypothetical protein